MSNDVKVDFDPDPNGNHQRMLEAFFEYINSYEQFHKYPSHYHRKLCRKKLREIRDITQLLKDDIINVHKTVLKLRREVYDENKRQREIKKASKGE
jgi:hypothetical protein